MAIVLCGGVAFRGESALLFLLGAVSQDEPLRGDSLSHEMKSILSKRIFAAILIMASASIGGHFKFEPFNHESKQVVPTIEANIAR